MTQFATVRVPYVTVCKHITAVDKSWKPYSMDWAVKSVIDYRSRCEAYAYAALLATHNSNIER